MNASAQFARPRPVRLGLASALVNRIFRYRWLATIALILCLDAGTYLALDEGKTAPLFPNQDKALHLLGFMGFFILGHISLNFDFFPRIRRFSWRLTALNAAIWIGYGLFLEMAQRLLSYRSASLADLAADVAGMALGAIAVAALKLYPRRPTPP